MISEGRAGLKHLHDQRIVHADIKGPNLMIFEKTEKDGKVVSKLKISDFGTATKIPKNKSMINSTYTIQYIYLAILLIKKV